ncbi:MAG: hypothetical protein CMG59_05990 [Candidatus Marinimicrobia bacterium]|nr:hypothetical protein [Candidatus Neomarinimicrobiota bacterium]MBJ48701.1 hypothetical protein [Candidatus Neomarinimicrobiota bacterium]|tara:strand:+ start:2368 stop:3018 length:651 start_codon:yes stop_codon:yes gene_type:complete
MLNTLIIKELKNELRTKETFFSMMTLGIVLIFLFSISSSNINTKQSIAFFWITIFIISSFGLYRSYQIEKDLDAFTSILSSPVDPGLVFLSKAISFFILITSISILLSPTAFFFLKIQLNNLFVIMMLSFGTNMFLSLLGNIICSMTLRSKNNEMIIPILLFPFSIPILLSIIKVTQSISDGSTFITYSNWIFLIIASNILFLVIGIWSYNDIIKE